MRGRIVTVTALALPLLCAGCLSVSRVRISVPVYAGEERAAIGMWVHGPGGLVVSPPNPLGEFIGSIIAYPFDVVLSTVFAIRSIGDPSTEIALGPVGAIAGIVLPVVTVIPSLYPAFSSPPTEISSTEISRLRLEVAADTKWAHQRVAELAGWPEDPNDIVRVELIDPNEPEPPTTHGRFRWKDGSNFWDRDLQSSDAAKEGR